MGVGGVVRELPAGAAPRGVRGGGLASGFLGGRASFVRGVTASGIVPRTVVPWPGEEMMSSVSADRADPVAHADQAVAVPRLAVDADPVIGDREMDLSGSRPRSPRRERGCPRA